MARGKFVFAEEGLRVEVDKQILIVHGWMHSSKRYERLKTDLEIIGPYKVTLYEFPGFGDTPAEKYCHLLKYYTGKIEAELESGSYDYVVGHSMGGNILLRAMDGRKQKAKLILLSPEYGGITLLKLFTVFMPVVPLVFFLLKMPGKLTGFFIKAMALFTVNRWEQIDGQMVEDVRKASPIAAACAMFELAWDQWRVKQWDRGETVLILGERDRIIERRKMEALKDALGSCSVYCIEGIGHTAVVEAYDQLLKLLTLILAPHI